MSTEILIVDDNSDIRNIIKELIVDAGYLTRVAANYNQAISEIDKKLPDVAILDVKLDKGDNDGIELLSHIKTKNSDILTKDNNSPKKLSELTFYSELNPNKTLGLIVNKPGGQVVNKNIEDPTRENVSLGAILHNKRDYRAGTRNSLELQTFISLITTLELAKCYPFFNASFKIPSSFKREDKTSVIKGDVFSATTLPNFLFGKIGDDQKTKVFV